MPHRLLIGDFLASRSSVLTQCVTTAHDDLNATSRKTITYHTIYREPLVRVVPHDGRNTLQIST
jgi:hypothetical protein